ncbi:hypothetical protein [Ileibacterium valens]|uniref:hypothetical protein n=1 Tax=Ileibacterium valens TaxID=1862668 RepID=UPI00272C3B43|nr:hypothetical protein [Ileibacterium valens]
MKTFKDQAEKLDESFGQYSSRSNKHSAKPVTTRSEDDKKAPIENPVSLDYRSSSDPASMMDGVSTTVTPEQRLESDKILAEQRLEHAEQVLEDLKNSGEEFKKQAEEKVEQKIEEEKEMAQEAKQDFKARIDELQDDIKEDPKGTLIDLGKLILMILGALSIIRFFCKKH